MTASTETLKSFLIRTPFFGGLEDKALDRIIAMLVQRKYPCNATVFKEGDTGRSMYVIAKGEVVMSRAGESGHQVKLVRLHEGDFFGETTLIEMQPRPSCATAATDATLYELGNMDLYKLYQADVKAYVLVLQNINRELCRRLRKADTRITEFADEAKDDITQIGSLRKSTPPTKT
jgi:CRP/FNR family transcriptional regulator, cyclic AMP receptor protein